MKVLIYNEDSNRMESYNRRLGSTMPYIKYRYLTIKEFMGSSKTKILWSTKRTMEAFNTTRARWRKPLKVGYAFKRIFEGGHSGQSQHYAGVSFDTGQNLTNAERRDLYNLCVKLKLWTYVEPLRLTPTWVHFDKRAKKSACSAGYPEIKYSDKGVYVLILQDALMCLGYKNVTLDGIFGKNTQNALNSFQKKYSISDNGIVKCATWQKITQLVTGKGKTSTVAYY